VGLSQTSPHQFGDWRFSGSMQRLDFTDFSPKKAYGITTEVMLTSVWGVEFSVAGGQDYFEASAGPLSAIYFMAKNYDSGDDVDDDDEDDGFMLTLFTIAAIISAAEHSNFHITVSKNLELIPNFSLLKYRYMYDKNNTFKEDEFLSWSMGLKVGVYGKKNWFYDAYAERAQLYYSGRPHGWQIGLHAGYIFKNRKGNQEN